MVSHHPSMEFSKAVDAAVDFRGNPVDKSRSGGWLAAGLILGTELAERVCVMGISMNLVTYLVGDLHLSTSKSANIVTNFMGTLNLLALIGGFLADAKLGRYLTAVLSASTAVLGMSLLTIATSLRSMRPPECDGLQKRLHECVAASGGQQGMLLAALYIVAVGGGGVKANVSGFASDQFDPNEPREARAMAFFFNRFYFCISLGSLFSVTVLVYLQDNVGRGWGYGISAATMTTAMVVLLAGTPKYRFRRPQGSPITAVCRVLCRAWRNRGLAHPERVEELYGYHSATVPHTSRFRFLEKAAIVDSHPTCDSEEAYLRSRASTVTQVEEVKMVIKLLPIWTTCILFWTVYSQMTTFSVEQATYMNRSIGSLQYPAGSLSLFLFITILLVTSLNEKLLVPLARRFTRRPEGLTSLQRVGIGLVFSILAMAVAAVVERRRRDLQLRDVQISVFWLVPQFCLVGIGEGFAYVGQLEFFIREAPERMKSMSTGLFLSTLSMGFFLSSALVSLVDGFSDGRWIRNNLDRSRLEYFYCILVGLGVINFVVFLLFSSRHEYKVQNHQAKRNGQELELWNDDSCVGKTTGGEV